MTTGTLAVGFSIAGGACELLGLAIVIREIASDRARGRQLLARLDSRKPPKRTHPLAPMASSSPMPNAGLMSHSTQVAETYREVQRLEARVSGALVKLKQITDAELDQAVERVQNDLAERDAELRDGLRYVLAGSTRDRIVGAGLLVGGIVLAAAGSVLSGLS